MYAIAPYSECPIMQINSHIGDDDEDGVGIDGRIFSKELFEIDAECPKLITIYINSIGGDVQQGFDILNAIANLKSDNKVIYNGFAFSTAGWCGLSAKRVEASSYSTWMCHLPYHPEDDEKRTKFLDYVGLQIANIIASCSGRNGKEKLTQEFVFDMMKDKTYKTAQELYNLGLIDEIIPTERQNISTLFNSEDFTIIKTLYKKEQIILNKFIETFNTKTTDMSLNKVVNRLNLSEGTNEEGVIAEIANRENRYALVNKENESLREQIVNKDKELKALNESKAELERKKTEMENAMCLKDKKISDMEAEMTDKEKERLALETFKNEAMNRAKEAEEAKKTANADALINEFKMKIGNKEEAIASWKEMAIANYASTRAILEAMPVNMNLPTPIANKGEGTNNPRSTEPEEGSLDWYRAKNKEKNAARHAATRSHFEQAAK